MLPANFDLPPPLATVLSDCVSFWAHFRLLVHGAPEARTLTPGAQGTAAAEPALQPGELGLMQLR